MLWLSLKYLASTHALSGFRLPNYRVLVLGLAMVVVLLASIGYAVLEKPVMQRMSRKTANA